MAGPPFVWYGPLSELGRVPLGSSPTRPIVVSRPPPFDPDLGAVLGTGLEHRTWAPVLGVGDGTRVPLMLALVDGQKFSDEEIEQFKSLIDQLEHGRKRKKRSGGKEQS